MQRQPGRRPPAGAAAAPAPGAAADGDTGASAVGEVSWLLPAGELARAVRALRQRHPDLAASLPAWAAAVASVDGPPPGRTGDGPLPGPTGGAAPGAEPPVGLAAALNVHAEAWAWLDVDVVLRGARRRGRWSLGAVGGSALVLGAGPDGQPAVEVTLLAPAQVPADVLRRCPEPAAGPDGSPHGTATSRADADGVDPRGTGVAVPVADLLALPRLPPGVGLQLLRDVERCSPPGTADAVQRCADPVGRVDTQVTSVAATWCTTWLLSGGPGGPGAECGERAAVPARRPPRQWWRVDPGPARGTLLLVPVPATDVADRLRAVLCEVACAAAASPAAPAARAVPGAGAGAGPR